MIQVFSNPPENEFNPQALLQKAGRTKEFSGIDFELYCEDRGTEGKPQWAMDNYRLQGAHLSSASVVFYTQPGWGRYFEEQRGRYKVQCQTYACDPKFHKPQKVEKIYDVGFIGQFDGDDRPAYLDLIKEEFPDSFISNSTELKDLPEALSKCKVLFNHIRTEEINIRFFECLALGAQVATHSPALHLYADEGKHYLSCSNPKGAVEQIKKLLSDDSLREKMAKDARAHAIKNHTYAHRLRSMIDFMKKQ